VNIPTCQISRLIWLEGVPGRQALKQKEPGSGALPTPPEPCTLNSTSSSTIILYSYLIIH